MTVTKFFIVPVDRLGIAAKEALYPVLLDGKVCSPFLPFWDAVLRERNENHLLNKLNRTNRLAKLSSRNRA